MSGPFADKFAGPKPAEPVDYKKLEDDLMAVVWATETGTELNRYSVSDLRDDTPMMHGGDPTTNWKLDAELKAFVRLKLLTLEPRYAKSAESMIESGIRDLEPTFSGSGRIGSKLAKAVDQNLTAKLTELGLMAAPELPQHG